MRLRASFAVSPAPEPAEVQDQVADGVEDRTELVERRAGAADHHAERAARRPRTPPLIGASTTVTPAGCGATIAADRRRVHRAVHGDDRAGASAGEHAVGVRSSPPRPGRRRAPRRRRHRRRPAPPPASRRRGRRAATERPTAAARTSNATTSWPAASTWAAIGWPMFPSPIQATRNCSSMSRRR